MSSPQTQLVTFTISNEISEITRLSAWLRKMMNKYKLPEEKVFKIELCLDELITNTISYGYPQGQKDNITVSLKIHPDHLEINIEDDALKYNPLKNKSPDTGLGIEERPIGGLGIHLVQQFSDLFTYEETKTGNRVQLLFKILNNN